MNKLKLLALSLVLSLFIVTGARAAIVPVEGSGPGYVRTTITATNTTNTDGDNCLAVQGYIYKSVIADEVSGTAVWNLVFSNDFKTTYAPLLTAEASDNSYEMTTAMTHLCVTITTCSTCVLKVTIYGQNQR